MYKLKYHVSHLLTCTLFISVCSHAESLSKTELDTIVKEDIATAQVLIETCPALVGHSEKIKQHVDQFTQDSLNRLNTPISSIQQLQQDKEYIEIFKSAKAEALAYDKNEQKSGCEEVLSLEND